MPDDARPCPRCGSDSIIPDVRVLDRGDGNARAPQEVGVVKRPEAMLFKDEIRTPVTARVCADCGAVELTATDPDTLWTAHLERVANGWGTTGGTAR